MSAVEQPHGDIHRRASTGEEILRIEGLVKHFPIRAGLFKRMVGQIHAVDGVDLTVQAGETLGLVGESGCGKSVTCHSIVRLLPSVGCRITGGKILFDGTDLVAQKAADMRKWRGAEIGSRRTAGG